jgi:hypothetical protein
MSNRPWMDLVITGIMIVVLSACGIADQETSPTEPPQTQLPGISLGRPATRTPFPGSCNPADSTILEAIQALEILANEKNLEGTMELFAENAILEESYRGVYLDEPDEIEDLWREYYSDSLLCEFRDISICENLATFIWAELQSSNARLWPVVIEVHNGKITYMDFYDFSITGPLEGE